MKHIIYCYIVLDTVIDRLVDHYLCEHNIMLVCYSVFSTVLQIDTYFN